MLKVLLIKRVICMIYCTTLPLTVFLFVNNVCTKVFVMVFLTQEMNIRKNRLYTKGDGVCALIKHRHAVVPIDLHEKYSELEILVLDFKFSPVLRVFVIYRPPHYDVKAVSYVRLLTEGLNSYQSNKKMCILLLVI